MMMIVLYDYGEETKAFDEIYKIMLSEIETTSEVKKSNYIISEVSTTQGHSLIVRVENTLLRVMSHVCE